MSERSIYKGFYEFVVIETDHGDREIVKTSNSVSLLIHDIVKRKIILLKQKREAMHRAHNPGSLIIESVAGRFDADFGVKELMVREAKEEAGVTLVESQIKLLNNG